MTGLPPLLFAVTLAALALDPVLSCSAQAVEPTIEEIGIHRLRNGGTGAGDAATARANLGAAASDSPVLSGTVAVQQQITLPGRTWTGASITANANLYENSTWTGAPGGNLNAIIHLLQTSEGLQLGTGGELDQFNVHNTSTTGFTGQRIAGLFVQDITGTSGNTAGLGGAYVGLTGKANGLVNDGGASGAGNSRGFVYGMNAVAHLGPSATFWSQNIGAEFDTWVESGASVVDKIGTQIVDATGSTVNGTRDDIGLSINNGYAQGSGAGWLVGIEFGRQGGFWPMKSTGTMIGATTQSGTLNVAHGIDWSGVTFSSDSLKMPGFTVSGTGLITTGSTTLIASSVALTNGAAAAAGTLTNAPAAGNPTKWVPINDNGTTRYVPSW